MPRGYRPDLAYIHDVGYGDFALSATPGLLALLRRNGVTDGLVIDLGCGSGLWARELCDAGYRVLGIDQSAAMLTIARQRVPEAEFRKASLFTARLPQCDAVTSLGECVNFLLDPMNNLTTLAKLFERVYDVLRPGGVFIFDVYEPNRFPGPRVCQAHRVGDDWAVLVRAEETDTVLIRHITAFRRVGSLYRRSEEVHRLRLYPRDDLLRELRSAGFRVRTLRRFGEYRLSAARVAFVARKRAQSRDR